jgi:hypothetical protein
MARRSPESSRSSDSSTHVPTADEEQLDGAAATMLLDEHIALIGREVALQKQVVQFARRERQLTKEIAALRKQAARAEQQLAQLAASRSWSPARLYQRLRRSVRSPR